MNKNEIYLGTTPLFDVDTQVNGGFVKIDGQKFYKISNYDRMADFFMTIVSDSDHWMFISSNGSLSAGRKDRDNALFPYYTDDKIHDYRDITGSKTIVLVEANKKTLLWEPFSKELGKAYKIERNLYKSELGDKIIFEEVNIDLGVSFRYGWSSSEKFGFIKKSIISNLKDNTVRLEILDGIKNILPSGVTSDFQNAYSNLLDGYKKNELIEDTSLGLFSLSSIPVDRAEPSESLNTTTVWSHGLSEKKILISNKQIEDFRKGKNISTEVDVRASRGAYLINTTLELIKDEKSEWMIVAEINQDSTSVANLNYFLKNTDSISNLINDDIQEGSNELIKIVAGADGLQKSNDELNTTRHFSNTMFNVMRGGIYLNNYSIETSDFKKFFESYNKSVYNKFVSLLEDLPLELTNKELIEKAENTGDSDFIRICNEYLPLTFSRRHGDPSRPWNQFSIDTKNEDGSPKSDFQGNWRDIFQNWEALSVSYPEFIENIISKFVNASTADGYNPYRIMRDGIDWESPHPDDPWAYIGYWGDHQIIYLQKLLELSENHHPGKLDELLSKEVYSYANVPYRIKEYTEILKNPKDTIEFDYELNDKIDGLVKELGADGRLILNNKNEVYSVNLTEKILVTLLAKLSNFVPEAGIWLNTQRPEWNDANNALVGNGVSMVTLYYMRRFLKFWNTKFSESKSSTIDISEEVKDLFNSISKLFADNTSMLQKGFSNEDRKYFTDILGDAGSTYRNSVYNNSFSGSKKSIKSDELVEFTTLALKYIDQSIKVNKREDGLYHAYNLISIKDNGISIRYLYEMLEGQVAVLSSGYLSTEQSLEVFDSLKNSKLFREDQYSYILYPDRELPLFVEKNNIPNDRVNSSKLLSTLVSNKDESILSKDDLGNYHFNGEFRNADVLNDALNSLDTKLYGDLLDSERESILDILEGMFDHQSFTGRSGTFYAYEGLGSIYWHMVSKLLLCAEDSFFKATDEDADPIIIGKLKDHYYEIKAGIGVYKSPELYGAFPTDAYSHTPGNAGVKQPGMTGQVKEDIISRMGELGVRLNQGEIIFDTKLFDKNELLKKEEEFDYYSNDGNKHQINLVENQLAFTICQIPVVYTLSNNEKVIVTLKDGQKKEFKGTVIGKEISKLIFGRNNIVDHIEVSIK